MSSEASEESTTDHAGRWWVRAYVLVPLVAATAAVGLASLDPTGVGLGPARYGGLVIGAAGIALVAWTVVTFSRAGETLSPVVRPDRLVTAGPLAVTRNPLYLGVVTTVAGIAVLAGSPAVAGYTVVLAVVYHGIVVLVEEPKLEGTFGDTYRSYCDEVPRWLPRVDRRL